MRVTNDEVLSRCDDVVARDSRARATLRIGARRREAPSTTGGGNHQRYVKTP
jgi:hypothetical protein